MTTQHFLANASSVTPATLKPSGLRSKVGWGLTALPCAMVFVAGLSKFVTRPSEEMLQGMRHVGVEPALLRSIGILEVTVVALCLFPRTAFFGAILFTGWAGGAIMTHLRIGEAFYLQALLAVVVWVGFALRRPSEIRALIGRRGA